MVSASLFVVSLLGVISLVSFRMWEIRRGMRLFPVLRRRLDVWTLQTGTYIRGRIPVLGYDMFVRAYHAVMHRLAVLSLKVLKAIEKKIIGLLEYLRGKRNLPKETTRSEFLKQVSEHKRNLENPSKDAVE